MEEDAWMNLRRSHPRTTAQGRWCSAGNEKKCQCGKNNIIWLQTALLTDWLNWSVHWFEARSHACRIDIYSGFISRSGESQFQSTVSLLTDPLNSCKISLLFQHSRECFMRILFVWSQLTSTVVMSSAKFNYSLTENCQDSVVFDITQRFGCITDCSWKGHIFGLLWNCIFADLL